MIHSQTNLKDGEKTGPKTAKAQSFLCINQENEATSGT